MKNSDTGFVQHFCNYDLAKKYFAKQRSFVKQN